MSGSASRSALSALVAVLCLASLVHAGCPAANSSLCGVGTCAGYIMINGECTSICSSGSYYDHNTSMCLSCSTLGPASCGLHCPNHYYAPARNGNYSNMTNTTNSMNWTNSTNNTLGNICQSCADTYGLSCLTCTAAACSRCIPGHQLAANGQFCVATSCKITNCVQCSGTTRCYLCEPGFAVSPSGQACVPANCSVSYCSLCSGANCFSCISGYRLVSGKRCRPICDPRCTNCIAPSICAMCESGYALDNSTYSCRLNCSAAFDGHCVSCQNLLYCTTCEAGYVPALGGAICQPVYTCSDPRCSACSIASICTRCNTGYYLVNGSCVRDICFIGNCIRCASVSTCNTCAPDFVRELDNSRCVPACSQTISNCKACNSSTSCQVCAMGYTLSGNKCVPLCRIAGCSLCLTQNTCLVCESGMIASDDFSSCDVVCSDAYCQECNTSSNCQSCVQGYSLQRGRCKPNCRQGSAMNQEGVCQPCRLTLGNCQRCAFDSSNTISCTHCNAGFYLASGSCFSCRSAISNCRLCNTPQACSMCARGYALVNGSCLSNRCDAKNCLLCRANSTSECQICAMGFRLNSRKSCQISCKRGQTLIRGVCSCPLGTYLPEASGSCTPCADSNCLSCTVNTCSACIQGYFASGEGCEPCMDNCAVCVDADTCTTCAPRYVYSSGSCRSLCSGFNGGETPSGGVFTCDPGCNVCGLAITGTKVCLTVLEGYSSVSGSIIKCDPSCATCSANTAADCLSCFSGNVLNNGVCLNCTDPAAITCSSTDPSFSLTCTKGFTAFVDNAESPPTSRCRLCAGNCYRCDVNGPGTCDAGQCEIGYVQQPGNKNCTQCFGGCPSCDPNDLMNCLSCGPRRYTSPATGKCEGCPPGCQNCNSSAVCTSCFPNHMMVGTLCQVSPVWPCIAQTSGSCTACVEDFAVKEGKCVYSSNCSATASCSNCPYGYFLSNVASNLQGICTPCPSLANCLTCSSANSSDCFLCNNGYYVSASGDCVPCSKGCQRCTAGDYCIDAAEGYFLVSGAENIPTGMVALCASPCKTCDFTPNFCLSCEEGFAIAGSTCFSKKAAYYTMTFNLPMIFDENDSFDIAYGKICNNIGYFRTTICQNLPQTIRDRDPACKNNFNFLRFTKGSISTTLMLDIAGYSSAADATRELNEAKLLPEAQVISTSVSTTEDSSSSNSGPNLGLILGVSIPVGLLLLMIVGIIVYSRRSEMEQKQPEESGKPIEYDNADYPDRPRIEGRNGQRQPIHDIDNEERVHRL